MQNLPLPYLQIHRNGNSLNAYFVSFPCFLQIVGPNPIANSFTFTWLSFATRKCPVSCIRMRNPNTNMILIATIKNDNNFYPPLVTSCQWGCSSLATYNIVNNAYANGAKNIKLSILSNIPP